MLHVALAFALPFQALLKRLSSIDVSLLELDEGIDQGSGHNALLDVVIGWFAELLRILRIV
jgi:hypothetical protein